jgi:hypothetical protein
MAHKAAQHTCVRNEDTASSHHTALSMAIVMAHMLQCTICCEEFTVDGAFVPRLLPCGHTMCHTCVCKLAANKKASFMIVNGEIKTALKAWKCYARCAGMYSMARLG